MRSEELGTNLVYDLRRIQADDLFVKRFWEQSLRLDASEVYCFRVESEATIEEVISSIKYTKRSMAQAPDRDFTFLFELDDVQVLLQHYNTYTYVVNISGRDRERVQEIGRSLRQQLPVMSISDPDIIPMLFWSLTPNGPRARSRRVTVPSWKDVSRNYTKKTKESLGQLLEITPPMTGGRIILWHGEPGTGKTYAIRAAARAWKDWCRVHYIVDPDKFFDTAEYLLEVVLSTEGESSGEYDEKLSRTVKKDQTDTPMWKLLIMEDSDEFLTLDAKQQKGQALSRLLNVSEGLIGQGLNLLFLITTNEPLDQIHKAVKREGRCMANIEFGRLSHDEALAWVQRQGLNGLTPSTASQGFLLSELYGKINKPAQLKAVSERQQAGFVTEGRGNKT